MTTRGLQSLAPYAAPVGTGVLLAFSFPNVSWGFLAFVALTPLIIAARASRGKFHAFLLGWIAYTITWLINVPWVVIVMSRYGGLSKPVGILMFVAMSLVLGAYGGLFALLVRQLRLRQSLLPWLAVPAAWIAVEYARTYLLTGFPWHLIGTALIDLSPFVQPARWIGVYGIGFLVVTVSTVLAWLLVANAPARQRMVVLSALIPFVALWAVVGVIQLRQQDERMRTETKYRAAMLQPNITQEMRWDDKNLAAIFERMARLTDEGFQRGAIVVVWPESTLPLLFVEEPLFQGFVETASKRFGGDVVLGSVARDQQNPDKLWNAAYLVSAGAVSGRYDKLRLVPFGEYVPLRKLLFFAEKLVRAVGDFQFGTNDYPLVGKFKYGPAICYEVVYPRIPADQVRNGAEVLVTITNDAWFDRSAAPWQHLNQARFRSVETDRYFLRAATTGISALIDPAGRIVEQLDLNQEGMVFGEFAPRQSETAYVRFGDWPAWLSIAATLLGIVTRRKVQTS